MPPEEGLYGLKAISRSYPNKKLYFVVNVTASHEPLTRKATTAEPTTLTCPTATLAATASDNAVLIAFICILAIWLVILIGIIVWQKRKQAGKCTFFHTNVQCKTEYNLSYTIQ